MQEFVFIFHSTAGLEPDAMARRNAAAREWALARQREGTLRHASPLDASGSMVSKQGAVSISDAAIASVLIIEANDLASAIELAKRHPGLAFGTEIEVRPVKVVAPPPP